MANLLSYLKAQTQDMVSLLQKLVEMESPTSEKEAVDALGSFLRERLVELGAQVEVAEQAERGNHLLARWEGEGRQVLILCHMDTVWPIGTLKLRPFRRDGGIARGPGIFDMKGGIVVALYAMKGIKETGCPLKRKVTLLINSDEEVGSDSSKELIEREAKRSEMVLVLEPALPPEGALKTFRKGWINFDLRITGRASHAGADPKLGVNAIQELAHQVLRLHQLADHEKGTTVNIGVVEGGTVRNMIAPHAHALIDVRVSNEEEAQRIIKDILSLKPVLPGAKLEIEKGHQRPPFERTPKVAALFQQAKEVAREIGLELKEGETGGASDGNLTAALGVPTLDGLGVVGAGAHSEDEHIEIAFLPQRAALLALLLQKL